MSLNLLSATTRVETPFIIAEFGGVTFGVYDKETKNTINNNQQYRSIIATYPNFMNSLTVTKINGTVNTYSLSMIYAMQPGDDPNLIDKILSRAGNDRTIKLSYGDLSLPSYIYKEEEAIITDVKHNFDLSGAKITYVLSCTSKSLLNASGNFNFPKVVAKPSDIIEKILYDNKYGLLEVFYGMKDRQKVLINNIIARDDAEVTIEAKQSISPLNYLDYLIQCMIPIGQRDASIMKRNLYKIVVSDLTNDIFEGPYFKVVKVDTKLTKDSIDTYEIDVGFPGNNIVTSFDIDDDQTFSILYEYAEKIDQPKYIQRIDNDGNIVSEYSPSISNSSNLLRTTEQNKTWWTNMTSYPIKATLGLKGLLKPAILMSYVYLNVSYFGQKHYSSGYYIITKQVDNISSAGYRTTLSLTKIQGDEQW